VRVWWKDLRTETESEVMLQAKRHATKILQTETEGKCQQYDETVVRVISASKILLKKISSYVVRCTLNYNLTF
jgi:hypothetical protein